MDEKEVQDDLTTEASFNQKNEKDKGELEWSFCPVCANEIPNVKNLVFCIKCGTNLQYLKEHKRFPSNMRVNPYIKPSIEYQYIQPISSRGPDKISDENIFHTKEKKLWKTSTSIGIPLGAFLVMNLITAGIILLITIFSFNSNFLNELILNPYFIILLTLFELIFILFPVSYVAKYLENPNIENRFALLGFTTRGYSKSEISREIFLGLLLGIIGMFLVFFVSFFSEILVELVFSVEIIQDLDEPTSDVDLIISSADIFSIILFSFIMILVVGTSEEILFRGFMQKGLVRRLGTKGGMLVTALIFSLIHLIALFLEPIESPLSIVISFILSFFPYFAISIFLGLIYQWRNENLIAVIITHGVYNTLTIILAFIFYGMV
jgi:membrane protease YdiL (CAAX protease family)